MTRYNTARDLSESLVRGRQRQQLLDGAPVLAGAMDK